ncbi:MAG: GNAT family N-acetyltransferase [Phycisphaeraceae bacterium]|nr:GNAT family N-acetyltransferase [Phycisphaeraceae bacterium]
MSQSFSLRLAQINDVQQIHQLICEIATYEKLRHEMVATVADLRAELFGPRPAAEVILAECEKQIVGYALFFHNFSTFLGRRGLYLEDLFVLPAFRGRGIGRSLFERVREIARERRCGRMEWTVLDWNTPARRFYAQAGAREMSDWILNRLDACQLELAAARPDAAP